MKKLFSCAIVMKKEGTSKLTVAQTTVIAHDPNDAAIAAIDQAMSTVRNNELLDCQVQEVPEDMVREVFESGSRIIIPH